MSTVRLAAGTSEATSAPFTLSKGDAIMLVPAAGQKLGPDSAMQLFYMNGTDPVPVGSVGIEGAVVLANGTYTLTRAAQNIAVGAVSEP